MTNVGITISNGIRKKGMTISSVARRVGMREDSLRKVVTGTRKLKSSEFLLICLVLELDFDDFEQTA